MLGTIGFALAVAHAAFYPALMQTVGERSRYPSEQTHATVRMTVQEAAEALGVTVEAIRGRMHRGKYEKEKDAEGKVWVLLSSDQLPNVQEEVDKRSSERSGLGSSERSDPSDDQSRTFGPNGYKRKDVVESELVEELRGEVNYLKEIITTRDEELRRKDTIIMQMAQRIPELEAAQEPREASETAFEPSTDTNSPEPQRRSWWRRFFGSE
jgi:hypothetical protein